MFMEICEDSIGLILFSVGGGLSFSWLSTRRQLLIHVVERSKVPYVCVSK